MGHSSDHENKDFVSKQKRAATAARFCSNAVELEGQTYADLHLASGEERVIHPCEGIEIIGLHGRGVGSGVLHAVVGVGMVQEIEDIHRGGHPVAAECPITADPQVHVGLAGCARTVPIGSQEPIIVCSVLIDGAWLHRPSIHRGACRRGDRTQSPSPWGEAIVKEEPASQSLSRRTLLGRVSQGPGVTFALDHVTPRVKTWLKTRSLRMKGAAT